MTSIDHANLARLDLNLLVAFDALLTERSVTRAAARIGLGQSAMSHNLARLRTLFGDELLTRGADGMRPTPRALALADPVRVTLSQIQAAVLQREARPESPEKPGAGTVPQRKTEFTTADLLELLEAGAPEAQRSSTPHHKNGLTTADLRELLRR